MISKREMIAGGAALMLPKAAWADDVLHVPFGIDENGLATIQAVINGQGPFTFYLNAGSGISTIKYSIARQGRLTLIGDGLQTYTVYADGQDMEALRFNAVDVVFAEILKRRNMVFMRLPEDKPSQPEGSSTLMNAPAGENSIYIPGPGLQSGLSNHLLAGKKILLAPEVFEKYAGMIGEALFLDTPSLLDYETGEIRFYPNGNLPLAGFQPAPAKVQRSGVNAAAIRLNARLGDQTLMPALDMCGRGLFLPSAYVKKTGLWDKFPDSFANHSSGNGQTGIERRVVSVKDFSLGPYIFDDINVCLSDPSIDDQLEETDCTVGSDLLSQFSIAFAAKGQIWLKPNASFKGTSVA